MTSASDANTAHSPLVTGRKLRDRTIAIAVFALVPGARRVRIIATALGDDAGITGAAILAHDHA